jgi:hypothetical protein
VFRLLVCIAVDIAVVVVVVVGGACEQRKNRVHCQHGCGVSGGDV